METTVHCLVHDGIMLAFTSARHVTLTELGFTTLWVQWSPSPALALIFYLSSSRLIRHQIPASALLVGILLN